MTQRYQQLFAQKRQAAAGVFVPFVMLGDPDLASSAQIIDTLVSNGADGLELGIPFSDPLADGPTIQNAAQRALLTGVTVDGCFALLAQIRQRYPDLLIGLLMYANLVYRQGIDHFYQRCAEVGVDSVLVADVPLAESLPFYQAAVKQGIAPIFICPPNADAQLIEKISQLSQGYVYLLSRAGVTGAENRASLPLARVVALLKQHNAARLLQGFGIASPAQVQQALQLGADGVICGSAIVKIIEDNLADRPLLHQQLASFIRQMKAATLLNVV